ncbi:sterigmatocystin 8-o-methyltransferase [Phlyctema vagabunda]|uniref:Sterigmatocystin 8-o-methyltransferase n=1 Tax=Phlyctema vagabunda TaxID=108571 RepID=A0ABR4PUS2_9HELO
MFKRMRVPHCVTHLEPLLHRFTPPKSSSIMSDSQSTLVSLAAKVSELSATLARHLKENNVPEPSFAADSPVMYNTASPEIFMARQVLLDALNDMWYLTQGPSESIFNYCHNTMPDVACLNILNHFGFWSAVPLDGSASYSEIAKHVNLPEDIVRRVLQHAVNIRLFAETEPGKSTSSIQHTCRSAAVAKQPGLSALIHTVLDEAGQPLVVINEALERFNQGKPSLTQEMNETAFALFHDQGPYGKYSNSWEFIEQDGEGEKKGWRQRNFVTFMAYLKEIFHLEGVVDNSYDWKSVGKASIVDIGGSAGHDAFVLAQKYPELTITVQDLPKCGPVFEANVPAELKSRVSFLAHDFFEPQPVQADIYIIKLILHDWPDKESVRMLRALTPALKPGARILFIEYIGKQDDSEKSAVALPRSFQQMGTATDLRMMALFNSEERPVSAWKAIFRAADERYEFVSVNAKPETFFAVIEVVWRG